MQVNSKNQTSFKANISFMETREAFRRLPKNAQNCVGYPYCINTSAEVFQRGGYTELMGLCTAGVISNGKDCFIFHLSPYNSLNFKCEHLFAKFNEAIETLTKQGGKLSALLVGGIAGDNKSKMLYEVLKGLMKNKYKLPLSSFLGQINPASSADLFFSAAENRCVINTNINSLRCKDSAAIFRNPLTGLEPSGTETNSIKSIENLRQIFAEVTIQPNDMVVLP